METYGILGGMHNWFSIVRLKVLARRNRWVQVGLLIALWLLADRLTAHFHVPIPGSVVGLLAMWAVLETKLVSSVWFERGADSLLDHLMLFFVPAMLGLVDHRELMSLLGLKLLAAILAGTLLVMAGTALVVELGLRWSAARRVRT